MLYILPCAVVPYVCLSQHILSRSVCIIHIVHAVDGISLCACAVGRKLAAELLERRLCFKDARHSVVLAAADTFRAAAGDQLQIWADRAQVPIVRHAEGADPAAVVFDGVQKAKASEADLLIVDTAGRLHNKKNLMEELRKISRVITREYEEAEVRTLLVIDATTGQNGLQQAREFSEVADVSGIVLTKLDGTAKGGIAVAIMDELKLPVLYIGVGEGIEDLQAFDANAFVDAIF